MLGGVGAQVVVPRMRAAACGYRLARSRYNDRTLKLVTVEVGAQPGFPTRPDGCSSPSR